MEQKTEQLLQYVDKLLEEGYDKDEILKKLNIADLPKKNVREVFTKIDDFIIKKELLEQGTDYFKIMMLIGFFFFLMGIIITIASYINATTEFYIPIGLIAFGLVMTLAGYSYSKMKDEDFKIIERKITKKFKRF